ncbi:MAG: copper-binding protein, partial [Pseudomonadota bacterium]|nr:copper-binding protein [Pseudomonadota bacterium]
VTIDHGPFNGIDMGAMTMGFEVMGDTDLSLVRRGLTRHQTAIGHLLVLDCAVRDLVETEWPSSNALLGWGRATHRVRDFVAVEPSVRDVRLGRRPLRLVLSALSGVVDRMVQ